MSTSVSNDSLLGTTAANEYVSSSLTLLASPLTRKDELLGFYNNNWWCYGVCAINSNFGVPF